MLRVEEYARIRRAHRDGMSIREIARSFGRSRRKIREVLRSAEPRPYRRTTVHRPKLTAVFQDQIDQILVADESAPRKQRHTAVMIHRRLQSQGFEGGYDQVRRYVKKKRTAHRETFIPLNHDPGQRAEADFGKIHVDFPEGRRQVSVLIIAWAYSNCTFAIALPNEKVESILYGTKQAFEFFRCVPKELWWDNPKTVVKEILKGRNRVVNAKYMSLASHYNFEPLFCLPARGNEKPHVENRVKFLQRNWATPVPHFADLEALNAHLLQCCVQDQQRTVTGKSESISTRFAQDRKHSLPLPLASFDPAVTHEREVDKYQTVAFDLCRYSVPRRYAFQKVKVKAYVDHIEVVAADAASGNQVIARHERCYEPRTHVLDPLHFLETLKRKPACLDHSSVYRTWKLPREISGLRDYLEDRHGPYTGARQYIRVLQLLATHPMASVSAAVRQCQAEGVVTAERIAFRCQRLAESRSTNTTRSSTSSSSADAPTMHDVIVHSIPIVHVPLPNFHKFDSFLSQGGDTDDDHDDLPRAARSTLAPASELETTSLANDVGRVREAGP